MNLSASDIETSDTFKGQDGPKDSRDILSAIHRAEKAFRSWENICEQIDAVYSRNGTAWSDDSWVGSDMDVFWASYEVMKEAVYARPPQPVVVPLFKDGDRVKDKTAELLERCSIAALKYTDINRIMLLCRDDLLFAGRGVMWIRHETKNGKHSVCIDHLNRSDFLHEPCRHWGDVGWVAARFWLTYREMKARFGEKDARDAQYTTVYDDREAGAQRTEEAGAVAKKCAVWEVWHKADDRVYWVTDGRDTVLDERKPHVELEGFFPCPEPAYATLQRDSLIPVPDYQRYRSHFRQINELTSRIFVLLECVKMVGLIPSGGDAGDAIKQALADRQSDVTIVPVAGAGLTQGGKLVEWLPLVEVATAIQGLFDARAQLVNDYYELSGISDIMRGATDASETLGAQQLKSQYGAVRVRAKSMELQRMAADAVRICAEIIAEKFPDDQILKMAQMVLPTDAEIKDRVSKIEQSAESELTALGQQAEQMAMQAQQSGEQVDPQQAHQMFQQMQQQIVQKYQPMLAEASNAITQETVMDLLRDDKARCFLFEIESSSTILVDEVAEKASRNEFLQQFTSSSQALFQLAGSGEEGGTLAGELLKFVMAPYRAGRQLDGAIDAWIEKAPEIAAKMAEQNGESAELGEANKALAEAEMAKAQAAMAKVQADSQLKQAEAQRKDAEMQISFQNKMLEMQQRQQELEVKAAETQAKIDNIEADTIKKLTEAGLLVEDFNMRQFESLNNIQMQAQSQAENSEQRQIDNQRAMMGEQRADRGEDRADRSQQFGEQQAMQEIPQ